MRGAEKDGNVVIAQNFLGDLGPVRARSQIDIHQNEIELAFFRSYDIQRGWAVGGLQNLEARLAQHQSLFQGDNCLVLDDEYRFRRHFPSSILPRFPAIAVSIAERSETRK
jgi:hypothetical protein